MVHTYLVFKKHPSSTYLSWFLGGTLPGRCAGEPAGLRATRQPGLTLQRSSAGLARRVPRCTAPRTHGVLPLPLAALAGAAGERVTDTR